jgi:hypothetical protein
MPDDNKLINKEPFQPDHGDATPPHGDELVSEHSFGRTGRYANTDDPDAERPVFSEDARDLDTDREPDARRERFERIDNQAARDARMAVRRRERKAE